MVSIPAIILWRLGDGADGNGFTTLYTVFIFQPYLIGGLEHDFFYFSIYWEE